MGSGNFRDISYICLQQDILVTSQGIFSPDSFFGFGWRSLAGAVPGSKTDSCLCGVFVPGKRFIWNKMGRAKGFVSLKTFSGTKCFRLKVLFHVSVFPERNRRGQVSSPRGGIYDEGNVHIKKCVGLTAFEQVADLKFVLTFSKFDNLRNFG